MAHVPTPLNLKNIDPTRQIIGRINIFLIGPFYSFLHDQEAFHVRSNVIRLSFYNLEALEVAQTCIFA